jgi:hypothetical protein
MGVLCYSPLQQGLLTGRFTKSEDVPEGRRRTRIFAHDSTPKSRHGGPGAEAELFDSIRQLQALADAAGEQTSMVDLAIGWLLEQPGVSCLLVGASTPEQATRNARIPNVPAEVLAGCTAATEALRLAAGPEIDPYGKTSRVHGNGNGPEATGAAGAELEPSLEWTTELEEGEERIAGTPWMKLVDQAGDFYYCPGPPGAFKRP